MIAEDKKHLVFTNSFNAWTIGRGLARLGIKLESTTPPPGLVPQAKRSPQPGDTLYFTEEKSLKAYAGQEGYKKLPIAEDLIVDDKLAFSQWLVSIGEKPVPFIAKLDGPTSFPAVVKAKHSWIGNKQLTRGFICDTHADMQNTFHRIDSLQLQRDWFFTQKYVSGNRRLLSTCGFFDVENYRRNAILVTERLLSTGGGLDSGAIVKTVPDPGGLRCRTESILAAMNYKGPFELEFIGYSNDQFFVLEMNPRFWLQHGLFIDFFNNALLSRYTDSKEEAPFPEDSSGMPPVVWLNTWFFLQALTRGKLSSISPYMRVLRERRQGRVLARWYPDWPQALSWMAKGPYRRLARSVRSRLQKIDALHQDVNHPHEFSKGIRDPQADIITSYGYE